VTGVVWTVVRREWTEQVRQPWMLASIGTLMALVAAAGPLTAVALQIVVAGDPALMVALLPGASPEALVRSAVTTATFLGFTQYLGIAAVMAGHGLLHDRQCGTFTFLLLAPISRRDLLLGKILGALALPTALYWVTTGLAAAATFAVPLARQAAPEALPGSPGFWVAWLLGGPAWSAFAGSVCAAISALASDVRTAQQGSWFVVFFASLAAGGVLVWGLGQGAPTGLGVAAVAACGAGLAVQIGAELLGRDLAR
jgi:ABC-type Na+ efflux pump permease subunit